MSRKGTTSQAAKQQASRRMTAGAVLFLSGLVAGGCTMQSAPPAASTPTPKKEQLVLVMPEQALSTPFRKDVFQQQAAEYASKYPGLTIAVETLPEKQFEQQVAKQVAEGKQVDLIFSPYQPLAAKEGLYADLMPFFKSERMTTDALYRPLVDMATIDNQLFGIPMSPNPLAVYYNKDWLKAAGAAEPKGDWTWEQFFELSLQIKAAQTSDKPIAGAAVPFDLQFYETIAQSTGRSVLGPDNKTVSGYLDHPSIVDALFMLLYHVNGRQAGKAVGNSERAPLQELTSSTAGMGIASYGIFDALQTHPATKDKMGVAALPKLPTGQRANTVYIHTLAVAAQSGHKETAWRFIKDVVLNADHPFQEQWAKQELLTVQPAVARLGHEKDPVRQVFLHELQVAVKPAVYRNPAILTVDGKVLDPVMASKTAEEGQRAMKEAAYRIEEHLAKASVSAANAK